MTYRKCNGSVSRRKFLKSNHTELNNILLEFERIVLVNPEISFTLHHNDVELFATIRLKLLHDMFNDGQIPYRY